MTILLIIEKRQAIRNMRFRSKRYKEQAEQLKEETMSLAEAVEKIKSFKAKFDQTVECVLNLGINPKQSDQLVRGSISLPNGIGKQKKVIAFCADTEVEAVKKAGAIEAGCDDLIKKVTDGWMDFDVAVASPKVMTPRATRKDAFTEKWYDNNRRGGSSG